MCARKTCDFPAWSAHTTTGVETPHPRLQAHDVGQEMLMPRHGAVDTLGSIWEWAEMKGWTPAHFEMVGREVVITGELPQGVTLARTLSLPQHTFRGVLPAPLRYPRS
ncbi:MAG: hypothetical protein Q9169_006950 [Polycauliona sp. 2 TL-2023]